MPISRTRPSLHGLSRQAGETDTEDVCASWRGRVPRRNTQDDVYQHAYYITESAACLRACMPPVCVVVRLVRARQGGRLYAPAPRCRLSRGRRPDACLRSLASVAVHALGLTP